jgi:fatty acid desaturase
MKVMNTLSISSNPCIFNIKNKRKRGAFKIKSHTRDENIKKWANEVRLLEKKHGSRYYAHSDLEHLKNVFMITDACYISGLATLMYEPITSFFNGVNIISATLISLSNFSKWMLAHYICHGSYNKISGKDGRFNNKNFAKGVFGRYRDWLDCINPDAWSTSHNKSHHTYVSQPLDPDSIQRNMNTLRQSGRPMISRYTQVILLSMIWKWFYQSPNSLKELFNSNNKKLFKTGLYPSTIVTAFNDGREEVLELFKTWLPYTIWTFIFLPSIGYVLNGTKGFIDFTITLILAELLTNIHSFMILSPSHGGSDLYAFETKVTPGSDEFYYRIALGTTNYTPGGNFINFIHGWENYHIEHHMFPNLSLKAYERMQPELKKLCMKYDIPYIQENVFIRNLKLINVMVGREDMMIYK